MTDSTNQTDWRNSIDKPMSSFLKLSDKQTANIEFLDEGNNYQNVTFNKPEVRFQVKVSTIQKLEQTSQGLAIVNQPVNEEMTLTVPVTNYRLLKAIATKKPLKGNKGALSRIGEKAETRWSLKFFDGISVEVNRVVG